MLMASRVARQAEADSCADDPDFASPPPGCELNRELRLRGGFWKALALITFLAALPWFTEAYLPGDTLRSLCTAMTTATLLDHIDAQVLPAFTGSLLFLLFSRWLHEGLHYLSFARTGHAPDTFNAKCCPTKREHFPSRAELCISLAMPMLTPSILWLMAAASYPTAGGYALGLCALITSLGCLADIRTLGWLCRGPDGAQYTDSGAVTREFVSIA